MGVKRLHPHQKQTRCGGERTSGTKMSLTLIREFPRNVWQVPSKVLRESNPHCRSDTRFVKGQDLKAVWFNLGESSEGTT